MHTPALEAVLREARAIPLTRELRIESFRLEAVLAEVREASHGRPESGDAIKELSKLEKSIKPINLTDQSRFDGKRAKRLAEHLRSASGPLRPN